MFDYLVQQWNQGPIDLVGGVGVAFPLYVALGLAPLAGFIYLLYFLLTLPLRRNERARLFLDLLELGLKEGRTPEAAVVEAASSRDRALGARFHLLAAFLERGLRLGQALDQVPRLLPPQLQAMLRAGEHLGDVGKVMPACRWLLNDGVSNVRGAVNYLVVLAFVVTPFATVIPLLLKYRVLPVYREVFMSMTEGMSLPALTRLVFATDSFVIAAQVTILAVLYLAMVAYVGGPRVAQWVQRVAPGLPDALVFTLPWRRKRLQRDFSAVLAALLDAEVPEVEAVRLAAEATANRCVQRRARRVQTLLREGTRLPEALRAVDDAGPLHWRLSNALRRPGSFARSLAGWHEALDARAFQLEQTAAQVTTTVLVLFNGLVVAGIVIGLFLALIQLINAASVW